MCTMSLCGELIEIVNSVCQEILKTRIVTILTCTKMETYKSEIVIFNYFEQKNFNYILLLYVVDNIICRPLSIYINFKN